MPQDASTTRDRLVSEACTALGELGLGALTVGTVARRAAVSTALVYYHFDTKDRLILAAAARIVPERSQRRVGALERSGLDALDVLWGVLEREVADGGERAYRELLLPPARDGTTPPLVPTQRNDVLAPIPARPP